jgi:hypothetical protein
VRVLRDPRGQASIDWIVVVGVVTVALAAAASVAASAPIAALVVRQFDRALCIVSGGDCNEDRVPCTTASGTEIVQQSLNLAIVKLSKTSTLLIERRSDGTYRVTRTSDHGLGFDVGVGASFTFSGLGLKLAVGGEARASVLAHLGNGETWLAHSIGEAAYDASLLSIGRHPKGTPIQRYSQYGWVTSGSASLTVDDAGITGTLSQDDIDGTRTDSDGDVTTYFRTRDDDELSATIDEVAGLTLSGMKSTDYALRADRTGRPIDFEVFSVGRGTAGVVTPGLTGAIKAASRSGTGQAYELEQHLDLSDPTNLAVAEAYLKARASGELGAAMPAFRALGARLAVAGVDQLRTFDVKQGGYGVSGRVALGLKVGASIRDTTLHMKLAGARVRGLDGVWTTRDDCLDAARRGEPI